MTWARAYPATPFCRVTVSRRARVHFGTNRVWYRESKALSRDFFASPAVSDPELRQDYVLPAGGVDTVDTWHARPDSNLRPVG